MDASGSTALFHAAEAQQLEMLQFLLDQAMAPVVKGGSDIAGALGGNSLYIPYEWGATEPATELRTEFSSIFQPSGSQRMAIFGKHKMLWKSDGVLPPKLEVLRMWIRMDRMRMDKNTKDDDYSLVSSSMAAASSE